MGAMMDVSRGTWPIRIAAVAWFVGGAAFLLAVPVILQAWVFLLPAIVVLAAGLAFPLAWVWRWIRKRGGLGAAWLKTAVVLTFLISVIVAAPVYFIAFYTQFRPALAPQVTLTNGERTVVIQGMQHVATDQFYRSVVFDLEQALSQGSVLFYEGVRDADPESSRWFQKIVTDGKDLTDAYRELGDICGLQFQNDYLQVVVQDAVAHPASHIVADVSTADLKAEYDRLMASDPAFAEAMAHRKTDDASTDGVEQAIAFLKNGTAGQRELAGVVCRGIMTMVMTRANDPQAHDDLDPLILDYRSRVLAERLLAERRPHSYVTYGAKHIAGTFQVMKAADPRWRVASVKWVRTIDTPQTYTRALALS